MNIVYCFDSNYFDLTLNSAKSIQKFNNGSFFYFLSNNLNAEQKVELEENIKRYTILSYDDSDLKEFDEDLLGYKHVSKACFVRLLIPRLLKKLKRALYVDGDTICKGSLKELYNTDFEGNYIIGAKGIDYSIKQAEELGIDNYINSGVLLFNIPLMNKDDYFTQIKENWRGAIGLPRVFSGDETIINYCFHKKIKLISEKYNYCYNRSYKGREVASDDVILWHVTGADKGNIDKLC